MLQLNETFVFEGQRVAWRRMGDGHPLVLIHGTPFSSRVWRRIAPLLVRRHTIYLFDLLGYGQSEMREGQDVSLGVQNKLLAALIQHWNLVRPDILCHDFGGATALRGYYLNGLRYRKLTMFDVVAVAPWGSPFVQHVRRHEEAFAGLPPYAHEALLRAYLQGAAYRPLSEEALTVHMAPWLGPVGQAAFYRQIAQMDQKFTDEIEPRYGPMDCDVRIFWGERDEWIPPERGRHLAQMLIGGQIDIVRDAGHLMQEDAPEAVVAAVLD